MHKQDLRANETTQPEATEERNCLTCKHWQPKANPAMGKHRLATCAQGPRWTFYPPLHQCPKQTLVAPAVAAVRVAWEAKA